MLPVWLGYYLQLTQFELGMVALGACLGHIFPIYYHSWWQRCSNRIRCNCTDWLVCSQFMLGVWLCVFLLTGYSSLSAVIAALTIPFYVWWFRPIHLSNRISLLSSYLPPPRQYSTFMAWTRRQNVG